MKYIKFLVITITITLTGVGVYFFVSSLVNDEITPSGVDRCKEYVEKDIHHKIDGASNSRFCKSEYDIILKDIKFYFKDKPLDLTTYTMMLNNHYSEKFVSQANFIFDDNKWKYEDIKFIREETKRLDAIQPDNEDLAQIKKILKNYDSLVAFDARIRKAVSQEPKCLSDALYLYQPDDWNEVETRSLRDSIPNFNGKVTNSPIYKNTRLAHVNTRLKEGHTAFIDAKIARSEEEAQNYNPNRRRDWETMGKHLYKCCETYAKLWNDVAGTKKWRKTVDSWEVYVTPTE